jgi:DNA-binding transcriptional MerR regulator
MTYLRTSHLATAVGVHPNTVRRYGDRGILSPVTRSASGYRRFTERHLDCLRLAWLVDGSQYPGTALRHSGRRIAQVAVGGDLGAALKLASSHLELLHTERAQADLAAALLERWASGAPTSAATPATPAAADRAGRPPLGVSSRNGENRTLSCYARAYARRDNGVGSGATLRFCPLPDCLWY